MEPENRLFLIGGEMDNRDPKEVAMDAAMRIDQLMDQLIKQAQEKPQKEESK